MDLKGIIKRPIKDIKVSAWFLLVSVLLVLAIWYAWHIYITTPPYVDEETFPVRGIDLSHHNGYANLDATAGAGYDFVFLKASEGTSFRDENFALNYQKACHAGLKVGAYHFFRFDMDGREQALNLIRSIASRPLDLGVVIDVEEHGNKKEVDLALVKERLMQMSELLSMRGYRVMFYSNRDGVEKYLLPEFEGAPLWVSSFRNEAYRNDWKFWQYNHKGKVPGVRGEVDLNAFCGSREEWERYLLEIRSEPAAGAK